MSAYGTLIIFIFLDSVYVSSHTAFLTSCIFVCEDTNEGRAFICSGWQRLIAKSHQLLAIAIPE